MTQWNLIEMPSVESDPFSKPDWIVEELELFAEPRGLARQAMRAVNEGVLGQRVVQSSGAALHYANNKDWGIPYDEAREYGPEW